MSTPRKLVVRSRLALTDRIVEIVLTDPDGAELPAWEPGAHVDLVLPSGLVRQYSLCGDPGASDLYRIAVRLDDEGRGGSREVHAGLYAGLLVEVRGPRNHFALRPAERYVFVAGGIGATPILPMVRAAQDRGIPWTLVYAGRDAASLAFRDEIAAARGGRVHVIERDREPDLDAASLVDGPGAVYVCGPERLVTAVRRRAVERGLDVYWERFSGPGETDAGADGAPQTQIGPTFTVELARTGGSVEVSPDESILEAVSRRVAGVAFSCREGYCGSCETRVLAGVPEHRDTVLTEEEQADDNVMMICVGRSRTPRLTLDL